MKAGQACSVRLLVQFFLAKVLYTDRCENSKCGSIWKLIMVLCGSSLWR